MWLQQARIVGCFNTLGSYGRHLSVRAFKSRGRARVLEGEGGKKHGNVQQQKTMTTCFEKRKEKKEYIICIYSFSSDLEVWIRREGGELPSHVGH